MSNRVALAQLRELTKEQVHDLPIDQIAMLLEDVADLKAQAKAADELLTAELDRRFGERAQIVRKAQGKDTGTVTIAMDGANIRADLPKRVTWNQAELSKAVETVRSWGEDPREYVGIEVKVSEAKYNAWPASIRKVFEPARMVGVGKATYGVELKQEAA